MGILVLISRDQNQTLQTHPVPCALLTHSLRHTEPGIRIGHPWWHPERCSPERCCSAVAASCGACAHACSTPGTPCEKPRSRRRSAGPRETAAGRWRSETRAVDPPMVFAHGQSDANSESNVSRFLQTDATVSQVWLTTAIGIIDWLSDRNG